MSASRQKIYIVRHGETAWSLSGQHTGITDLPLLKQGEIQAEKLRPRLSQLSVTKVFSSPSKRAQDTYKIAGFAERAEVLNDLAEWNYGRYEGLTTDEIHQQDPGWTIFTKGAPEGESVAQVQARADRLLEKMRQIPGDVLIFSSGHISRVLAARWLGLTAAEGRLFLLSPASLSVLGYERETAVILSWNEIS